MRTPSTSGSRGRANAHGPQVERTASPTTDTNATTAPPRDSTPSMRTGDAARSLAAGEARTMILLRAIVSTIAPDRARTLLATLAVWWHAVVALATNHSESALVAAHEAYDAADEHGDATTCAALVAAFAGVDASTLYGMARDPREASEVRNMAREALPSIAALLAELDAGSSCATAPSAHPVEGLPFDASPDTREAFGRALLEFAAEHAVASMALVAAGVMFPDASTVPLRVSVDRATTAVCDALHIAMNDAAREHDPEERLNKQDYAGCALRDAGRLLILGSRVLDSATEAERRDAGMVSP